MNIYIGNFSYDLTEEQLRAVFEPFGKLETAKIIKDKFTGQSKGFGFVEMPNNTEAQAALQGIVEIQGRKVTINEARPQVRYDSGASRRSGPRDGDYNRRDRRY